MDRFAARVALLCSFFYVFDVFAVDFETESWPGEGVPVLVASDDRLTLYERPELDSTKRAVLYRRGWRVPFDRSIYRTVASSLVEVQRTGQVRIWCDGDEKRTFERGEKFEYLQYRAEGSVIARIDGVVCEVPLYLEEEVFGTSVENPETEWWVRVVYEDGSSAGWLLVTDGQVSLDRREF